jgi:hypothetical protein
MRIDSSGNVGIGASSPGARLDVQGVILGRGDSSNATFTSPGQIAFKRSNNSPFFSFHSNDGTRIGYIQMDSAGAANITLAVNQPLYFATNDTERARITSGGDFLVGTTTTQGKVTIENPTNGTFTINSRNTQSSGNDAYGIVSTFPNFAPNNTSSFFYYGSDNSAVRFEVRGNGGIANYSANDVNLSDRREKTNFAPAKNYLETICAIPVQTFNYIDQNLEEDDGLTLGVVAQDVQEVAPELVMESNWGTQDELKMRLSIYQTDLQYALMKCIQELKAELDTVKAELATLKGN